MLAQHGISFKLWTRNNTKNEEYSLPVFYWQSDKHTCGILGNKLEENITSLRAVWPVFKLCVCVRDNPAIYILFLVATPKWKCRTASYYTLAASSRSIPFIPFTNSKSDPVTALPIHKWINVDWSVGILIFYHNW